MNIEHPVVLPERDESDRAKYSPPCSSSKQTIHTLLFWYNRNL